MKWSPFPCRLCYLTCTRKLANSRKHIIWNRKCDVTFGVQCIKCNSVCKLTSWTPLVPSQTHPSPLPPCRSLTWAETPHLKIHTICFFVGGIQGQKLVTNIWWPSCFFLNAEGWQAGIQQILILRNILIPKHFVRTQYQVETY